MGDRSNIFFRNSNGGIGVYGHWTGSRMAGAAMAVLNNKAFTERIGDAAYATRIGVQTVLNVLGADPFCDTGFGLWTDKMGEGDNSYRFIVIDVDDGNVYVADDWRNVNKCDLVEEPSQESLQAMLTHA